MAFRVRALWCLVEFNPSHPTGNKNRPQQDAGTAQQQRHAAAPHQAPRPRPPAARRSSPDIRRRRRRQTLDDASRAHTHAGHALPHANGAPPLELLPLRALAQSRRPLPPRVAPRLHLLLRRTRQRRSRGGRGARERGAIADAGPLCPLPLFGAHHGRAPAGPERAGSDGRLAAAFGHDGPLAAGGGDGSLVVFEADAGAGQHGGALSERGHQAQSKGGRGWVGTFVGSNAVSGCWDLDPDNDTNTAHTTHKT